MNVFCVFAGSYSDRGLCGVFSSLEAAVTSIREDEANPMPDRWKLQGYESADQAFDVYLVDHEIELWNVDEGKVATYSVEHAGSGRIGANLR